MKSTLQSVLTVGLLLLLLSGCSVRYGEQSPVLPIDSSWVLLPVINLAEAPLAGEKVEAMLGNALRLRGIKSLAHPVAPAETGVLLLDDRQRFESVLKKVKQGDAQYGITGTVNEWRYKVGLDGEPSVGLTLQVIELPSQNVLWSVSGARTGWGYASVSGTAEKLIDELLQNLTLQKQD